MELKDIVCSLELAKKLKELGIKQESLFWWCQWTTPTCTIAACNCGRPHESWYLEKEDNKGYYKNISAFTASELGELLPYEVFSKGENGMYWKVNIGVNAPGEWRCYLDSDKRREITFIGEIHTVIAKMLIYLLENKLITL